MEEKIIDSMSETNLTPADFITLMFERTDEDGILYIPGWGYMRPGWECNAPGSTDIDNSYRCKIDWNVDKLEKILKKFESVYSSIKEIAKFYDELVTEPEKAEEILKDETLLDVWNTYLADLDIGDFDSEKFHEIYEKLDAIAEVKSIAEKITKGEKLESFEKETLSEYIDITVSEEEINYRQSYLKHLHKQAELRLGKNICAYDILLRAWRLWRLFSLGAPEIIIYNEGRQLAAAIVLHEYGISREGVDNNIRLRLERMELMSDEELDELYRPQKTNTRKSMAPLFVYEILRNKSNSKTHLRQQDIMKELEKYPYEISLERKAVSRIIHNLIDTAQYAVFSDKTGVWVEQE